MQKFYKEAAREIPVAAEADIIVAGGGPAGVGAAVAAARNGAKVILLEKFNSLGGMATSGMMSHWSGAEHCALLNEVTAAMKEVESCTAEPSEPHPWTMSRGIWHEAQKTALQRIVLDAGVTIQYHTFVAGAIMDGDTICGVITESKSGREAMYAKVVIDATGDGDVAAFAGAEYQKGREEDGKCQPVTLMFRIGGVDYANAHFPGSFETYIDLPKGEIQTLGKSILPHPAGHVLLYRARIPGEVCVNMTNVTDIDGTDVRDLTKAEIICRDQIEHIVKFLREYVPGYEKCYLIAAAENVGVRETRHFAGEYTLTAEDVVEARVFEDWIATRNHFNFDIHSLTGPGLDKNGAQKHFQSRGSYTIPYRACLPVKVENLLLSGRNISGTHKAHSNYRVMGICMNIGQGVGIAAAVAVKSGVTVRNADIREVQKILGAMGEEP